MADPPRPTDVPWLERLGFPFIDADWITYVRNADDPEPIERIGEYELLEEIGHGGQAVVYRARRGTEVVAVKRLRAETLADADARHRFEREIEAVVSLNHPRVVRVLDVLREDRRTALVLSWVHGRPITEWAQDPDRTPREIVEAMCGVCDGLLHAHQRGVLHRDLKPSNLLVDRNGEPHILDFGLARLTDQSADLTTLTSHGDFLGTIAYASPEQLLGDWPNVDARSDVYSLGVVFFHALTGQLPWTLGKSVASAVRALSDEDPPTPSSVNPTIHRDLDAIVLKALRRKRDRRYQSADAFVADLARWLRGDPVEARGRGTGYVLSRLIRRHRLATMVAGAGLAVSLGLVSWLGLMYQRADLSAQRTERVQAFLEDTVADAGAPASGLADVVGILDRTAERATSELQDDPAVEQRLRIRLARRYSELGLWERVGEQAGLAIELGSSGDGSTLELARAYFHRGRSRADKQDPAGAEDLEQALTLFRTLVDETAPAIARVRTTMAAALTDPTTARDLPRAERELRAAIAVLEVEPGKGSRSWGMSVYCLGRVFAVQGNHEDAVANFREGLSVIGEAGGARDPGRARALLSLGSSLNSLCQYEEAESVFREALTMVQRVDWATPVIWANLGTTHFCREEYTEALDCYEQAIVARCRVLTNDGPRPGDDFTALAAKLEADGLNADIATRYREMISTYPANLLELFRHTAGRIAEIQELMGRGEQAEAIRAAL